MHAINEEAYQLLTDANVHVEMWQPIHGILLTREAVIQAGLKKEKDFTVAAFLISWDPIKHGRPFLNSRKSLRSDSNSVLPVRMADGIV